MIPINQLNTILRRYKAGKAALERRTIENEEFWRLRHWNTMAGDADDLRPTSAWLVNCILSKHADAMDAYPEPNVLPREARDTDTARALSAILPVVFEQNDFAQVWSDVWWHKLKSGTGVYKVMWDPRALGGLGEISVKNADVLSLFWEPGVTDIQQSPYFFHVELVNTERLREKYPQLAHKTGDKTTLSKYVYDDHVDTSDKSLVVDAYYKIETSAGSTLHYVKYCGETVLYSSEEEGLPAFYDHGLYPYVFDVLFPQSGSPCGFGYIDLCK